VGRVAPVFRTSHRLARRVAAVDAHSLVKRQGFESSIDSRFINDLRVVRAALCRVIGTACVAKVKKEACDPHPQADMKFLMCQDDIVDLLYSVCVEAREEMREAKHVNSQDQSISTLGFKQRCNPPAKYGGVAYQMQRSQYIYTCIYYFLRSLGGHS
jgi:hypothetical protein